MKSERTLHSCWVFLSYAAVSVNILKEKMASFVLMNPVWPFGEGFTKLKESFQCILMPFPFQSVYPRFSLI